PPVAPPPAPRQDFTGDFGHYADYARIQGILEHHYRGFYCLRYCDSSEEDPHGGKVRLEDDARLGDYSEADIIALEGDMYDASERDGRGSPPRYRIKAIQLVKKK